MNKLPARCQYRQRVSEMCRRYQAGEEINALALAYGVHSNSVRSALARRGIALRPRNDLLTREQAIADMQRIATLLKGGHLTGLTYKVEGGKHAVSVIAKLFGSWNNAMRAAGLEPRHVQGEGIYNKNHPDIKMVRRPKVELLCNRCDKPFMSRDKTKNRRCWACERWVNERADCAPGFEECA
jgi:hypothetical protein